MPAAVFVVVADDDVIVATSSHEAYESLCFLIILWCIGEDLDFARGSRSHC